MVSKIGNFKIKMLSNKHNNKKKSSLTKLWFTKKNQNHLPTAYCGHAVQIVFYVEF